MLCRLLLLKMIVLEVCFKCDPAPSLQQCFDDISIHAYKSGSFDSNKPKEQQITYILQIL